MQDKIQFNSEGQNHGYWEVYFRNKLLYKCYYINGVLHGVYEAYHPNGSLTCKRYYAR